MYYVCPFLFLFFILILKRFFLIFIALLLLETFVSFTAVLVFRVLVQGMALMTLLGCESIMKQSDGILKKCDFFLVRFLFIFGTAGSVFLCCLNFIL